MDIEVVSWKRKLEQFQIIKEVKVAKTSFHQHFKSNELIEKSKSIIEYLI